MKTEELMIGDWISLNYDINYKTGELIYAPVQITGINSDGTIDVNFTYDKSKSMQDGWDMKLVYPIPLTEEILEKNGYKKWTWWKHHKDVIVTYAIENGWHIEIEEQRINGKNEKIFNLVDNCNDSGDYGYESNYICDVQYVHELQHVLKLCKIEKEIVL